MFGGWRRRGSRSPSVNPAASLPQSTSASGERLVEPESTPSRRSPAATNHRDRRPHGDLPLRKLRDLPCSVVGDAGLDVSVREPCRDCIAKAHPPRVSSSNGVNIEPAKSGDHEPPRPRITRRSPFSGSSVISRVRWLATPGLEGLGGEPLLRMYRKAHPRPMNSSNEGQHRADRARDHEPPRLRITRRSSLAEAP
jgi:hypothetical protein